MSFRAQLEFSKKSQEEKEQAYAEANKQAAADFAKFPEAFRPEGVSSAVEVSQAGLRWDLFEKLSGARSIFPGIKNQWPPGQRANVYLCPLSGLLLFDPMSSQACGEFRHYYEHEAMKQEQAGQQDFRAKCNAQSDQLYPSFPPYVWQCPCCEARRAPIYVPASAFSHDQALREEIRQWLRELRLYLEELTEQNIDLLYQLKPMKISRENIVNIQKNLISDINHFLLYGNNKTFLDITVYRRIIDRARASVGLLREGDYQLAAAVSQEASKELSADISASCRPS